MTDIWDINRELEGRPSRSSGDRTKPGKKSPGKKSGPNVVAASSRALVVAQDWIRRAAEAGMEVPYNDHFLANRISEKAAKDPRFKPVLLAGHPDKVQKWLLKMSERFWAEYVSEEDTAGRVADVFLNDVWEDLRDYAYNCLRAAYLLKHGRPVVPEDPEPFYETDLHKDLDELRLRTWMEQSRSVEARELRTLGERERSVLESAKEKRRHDA